MNESQNDATYFETNLEKKEKMKNMLKINITSDENKYILKLYLSEEKNSIIFKLEQERIFSSFHFEKFFLNDFRQKSILFMRDYTIMQVLSRLKKLIAKKETEIFTEIKDINNIVVKMKNEEEKCLLNFDLKKIILTQNQLNPKLVEQIQENEALVNFLQKQINDMTKTLQEKTDLINSLNNNIININKTINDINNANNNINNNINNTINTNINNKEEESEEQKEEKEKEEKKKNNDDKNSSNEEEKNEIEDKRYISNNRKKKNKKKNKKIKFFHGENQNKSNQNNNNKNNDDNSIFCFENVEIIGNKKIFELLVVFNVIMILIILCLIGSIYSIKSNLEYEKILEEEFMNKLSYLNVYNDYGEDNYELRTGMGGGWDQGEFLIDEQQKLFFKEEIISKQNNKIKDIEFNLKYKSSKDGKKFDNFYSNCKGVVDTLLLLRNEGAHKFGLISKNIADILRGNKIKESQIKKNFMIYNLNRHDIFEYNIDKNFDEIYNSFIKNIFGFFSEKGEFDERLQFMGRILEIEIYELKYIK